MHQHSLGPRLYLNVFDFCFRIYDKVKGILDSRDPRRLQQAHQSSADMLMVPINISKSREYTTNIHVKHNRNLITA